MNAKLLLEWITKSAFYGFTFAKIFKLSTSNHSCNNCPTRIIIHISMPHFNSMLTFFYSINHKLEIMYIYFLLSTRVNDIKQWIIARKFYVRCNYEKIKCISFNATGKIECCGMNIERLWFDLIHYQSISCPFISHLIYLDTIFF